MSHDSTAAPEAAARKLSGRRRKEIVAVLLFSGGPIFESSIPLSVFGIDRQDAGALGTAHPELRNARLQRNGNLHDAWTQLEIPPGLGTQRRGTGKPTDDTEAGG